MVTIYSPEKSELIYYIFSKRNVYLNRFLAVLRQEAAFFKLKTLSSSDEVEIHQEEIIEKQVKKQVSLVANQFEEKVLHLQNQVEQLKSVLNNDSSKSSIPTSKTAIDHEKRSEFQRKNGKLKGGQPHHSKYKLEAFFDEDLTDFQGHQIKICSQCGHEMEPIGAATIKDEIEFKVVVKKSTIVFMKLNVPYVNIKKKLQYQHL